MLAGAALQKGLTPSGLALAIGIDRKSLYAYMRSARPRAATIAAVAEAVGLRPIVGRALSGELTDRDLQEIRPLIGGTISNRRNSALGGEAEAVWARFQLEWWPRLSREAKCQICAAFVAAQAGLPQDRPINAALGPYLSAVEWALRPFGYSMLSHVDVSSDVAVKWEATSWYELLRETVDLTDADEAAIDKILQPYLDREMDDRILDIHIAASAAAKKTYRDKVAELEQQ
jgi:hypothetical protein